MRVCVEKSTGKLIEMQSAATAGTLIQNALNAGFAEADIEEKEVTPEEWQAIQDAQPKPVQSPDRLTVAESDILNAMQAITEIYEQVLTLGGS